MRQSVSKKQTKEASMYCVETTRLSYRFSADEVVLSNLELQVPKGAIYGFLGANGAGKTTTMRLLLGLLRRQEGSIRIFGHTLEKNRLAILRKTGSLIETPSLYAQLTAAENLEVLRKIYRCPKPRIAEVLKIAGLADTGNKKAGKFSLGMKQRLGIAIALLNNPSLLILDEPTNGLDPNGIIEMRELLRKLNREQGITIIISSHLLTELERVVTHAGIIHKGRLLFQGSMEDLRQKQANTAAIGFLTNDAEATARVMLANGLKPTVQEDGQVTIPVADNKIIARLNEQLLRSNISIYRVREIVNDLESIFIDLTQK